VLVVVPALWILGRPPVPAAPAAQRV
jgi:hypothetical protein